MRFLLAAAMAASAVQQAWAAPIAWPTADGGNGHYYEWVAPSGGITWTAAQDAAAGRVWLGVPGHLATVASAAEWDFVLANFPHDYTWLGLTDVAVEGQFRWVTDEPLSFTAWLPQEPNNAGPENWVHYSYSGADGRWGWNDFRDSAGVYGSPSSYLVEYAVPEPSAWALVLTGVGGALAGVRRRRAAAARAP